MTLTDRCPQCLARRGLHAMQKSRFLLSNDSLMCFHTVPLAEKRVDNTAQTTLYCDSDSDSYLKVFMSHVSCLPVSRSSLPVPYWLMCSGCVLERRSMAASMAAIPPSFLMLSVEKLVCAPAPEHQHHALQTVNDCDILVFTLSE